MKWGRHDGFELSLGKDRHVPINKVVSLFLCLSLFRSALCFVFLYLNDGRLPSQITGASVNLKSADSS